MPRRRRAFYPGVPTHITARGVDDQPIFRSDLDRYQLLALLRDVAKEIEWQVLSWCLMTTHYHGHRTIGYILDNPVRAGMVKRFDEWPWSGLETLRPRDELGTLASSSRHILVRLGG